MPENRQSRLSYTRIMLLQYLREGVDDTVVEVNRVQVAVVVEEDLQQSLRRIAKGGHDVEDPLLMLESAVLTFEDTEEHCRDENLDLRLEVRLLCP